MKISNILLVLLFIGCEHSITEPELENFSFEFKHWSTTASRNLASTHWNRQAGIRISYFVRNIDDSDFRIEYAIIIKGARSQSDRQTLIPIKESLFLSSTLGLLADEITTNGDPVDIIENFILGSGKAGYVIGFAPVNWDDWWSIYSTVTIEAFSTGLSKRNIYYFEKTKEINSPRI